MMPTRENVYTVVRSCIMCADFSGFRACESRPGRSPEKSGPTVADMSDNVFRLLICLKLGQSHTNLSRQS